MKNRHRHAQVMDGPLPSRECMDCSEPIPDTETAFYWETSEDEQFWINAPKTEGPLCEACWLVRDNREGPEPNGEDFRGGEAAAYRAEQSHAAQRVK